MSIELTEAFWTEHYEQNQTGWDIGYASTPLVEYFNQLTDKNISILIPGAGNAYEAEFLFTNGFKNVSILDISKLPLKNFKNRNPEFPDNQLIQQNFFDYNGQYDLIIEQTFFCAIDPSLRQQYADKMLHLLKLKGKLVGLWFCFPKDPEKLTPPYTGTKEEYQKYFKEYESVSFSPCHNSIQPRMGRELFGIMKKQSIN